MKELRFPARPEPERSYKLKDWIKGHQKKTEEVKEEKPTNITWKDFTPEEEKSLISGPERQGVESTNVRSVGYDPESKVLEVEFKKSGAVYRYEGVSPEKADNMKKSHPGKYLAREIKGKYAYGRVE